MNRGTNRTRYIADLDNVSSNDIVGAMTARFTADDYLPLTTPMFEVLLALADGDKHGYAIIKEVRHRTDGRVRLSAGTLYGLLKRFIDDGLIAECAERPDPALDDER